MKAQFEQKGRPILQEKGIGRGIWLILLIFVVLGAVFVFGGTGTVSSFYNQDNPFNITIVEKNNYTTYLNLFMGSYINNITMNFTNYIVNDTNICYQEQFNESYSCGAEANTGGIYIFGIAQVTNPENATDGDYTTYSYHNGGGDTTTYINYTIPIPTDKLDSVIWQVKDYAGGGTTVNHTLPIDCYGDNKTVRLKVRQRSPLPNYTDWYCLNYSDDSNVVIRQTVNQNRFYEESIFWNWSNATLEIDTNISIFISNEHSINITDDFYTFNTKDLNSTNNILLDSCVCNNCTQNTPYCQIPIKFYSPSNNTLLINLKNATYSYGIDNCSNSFGIPSNATTLNISFFNLDNVLTSTDYETIIEYGPDTNYGNVDTTSGKRNNFEICKYPSWGPLYADVLIDYNNTFTYNTYQITLTNITQQIELIFPTDETTSEVTFTVLDSYDNEIENAYIQIQIFDISSNSYKTTEILETDSEGQAVGNIILATKYYRFIIQYEGETKLIDPETQGIKLYSTSRIFRINLLGGEWYDDEDEVEGISTSFKFNESGTNSFVFEWTNPTGTSVMGCMAIIQKNQTGNYNLFESCTTSASASIVRSITPSSCNTYTAIAYFDFSGSLYHIEDSPLEIKIECDNSFKNLKGQSGNLELVVLSWMVIMSLAFIGVFMPELSFILASIGIIGMVAMGMLSIAWQWVVGWIIIGIFLIFKYNKK